MQQLVEFIPIVLFFAVYGMDGKQVSIGGWEYTFDGIYSATAVLMIATIFQILFVYLTTKTVEKRHWALLAVVLIAGSLTLFLRNNLFIQWKPTIFNWGLALAFIITPLFRENKTLLESTLGKQMPMPSEAWKKLNLLWVGNFILVGALNLYVAYGYTEAQWVSYKLYSSIGFTVVLSIITAFIVAPYLKDVEQNTGTHKAVNNDDN